MFILCEARVVPAAPAEVVALVADVEELKLARVVVLVAENLRRGLAHFFPLAS